MLQRASTTLSPTAAEWLALGLISTIAVCINGWVAAVDMGIIGFSDTAEYLYFTDFYRAQFTGQTLSHAAEYYRTTRLPPLFPLVLAAFGGGTHALQWTQIIASAIALFVLVVMWVWLRRETESPSAAATITLLVVLSPGLFLLTLKPASEPLAMGMTLLTFVLATKPRATASDYVLLALIAGSSTLARSANIALVAAIPIWLYFQHGANRKQWLTATVVAFAPFALWLAYRRLLPNTESYLAAMTLDHIVAELGGWPDLLYLQPWTLFLGLARNFDSTPDASSLIVVFVLLLIGVRGWWLRVRAKKLDAVFLASYLGLILIWPYPEEAPRFMTFLLPILLLYALQGIQSLIPSERGNATVASGVLALAFVLISAGTLWHFLDLATLTVDEELRPEQREQLYFHAPDRAAALITAEGLARVRLAAAEAAQQVPRDDCVYATLPHLLAMRAPITVVRYPLRLVDGIPPEAQLRECSYFFVAGFSGTKPGEGPFHLLEELEPWTKPVLTSEMSGGGPEATVAALLVRTMRANDPKSRD